jgi:hypothetical protein
MKKQPQFKKAIAIFILLIGIGFKVKSQSSSLGHAGFFPTTDWCGWNAATGIPFNIEHRSTTQRINMLTNTSTRLFINNGANGQQNGRIAIGNALTAGFNPVDRLTLFESWPATATGSVQIRFQSATTGPFSTDGYAIGVNNTNNVVNHTQFEKREMRWLSPDVRNANAITEWMRIQNGVTGSLNALSSTDGYIGLNNNAPTFHIDGVTPAINNAQELFVSFAPSDAANSRMGMCNGGIANGGMTPTFFGALDNNQVGCGLQTIGSTTNAQDVTGNPFAVTQFRSGKNWVPNSGAPIGKVDPVVNRYIFSWVNGSTNEMLMNARGQLRIGDALNPNTQQPGNRLEITANATNDPYGTVIATNGASGLRLTHLTSVKTPTTNPNDVVLSVDANGDVILVPDKQGAFPGAQNGNNTSNTFGSNPGGKVELGGLLLHDTQILTDNNDFEVDYANGGNISLGENPNIVAGTTNQANIAIGQTNVADASANGNIMIGNGIHAFPGAQDNRSIGLRNNLYGTGHYVFGEDNTVGLADQLFANVIMGHHNSVDGQTNSAIGRFNQIKAVELSYTHGNFNYIQGSNAFAYGNYAVNNRGYRISIGNSFDPVAQNALIAFLGPNPAASGTDNIAHLDPTIDAYQIIPAININTNNYIGVKKYEPQVALDVWGSIFASGSITSSDSTLKTNIHRIHINATQKLKQFRPVTYEWITKTDTAMYGTKYGFTAQQIESVMPDLVITETNGIKHLDYNGIIPILVKALQEQQTKIDSLTQAANTKDSIQDARLTALENAIAQCCSNNNARTNNSQKNGNQLDVELSDKDAIVLNQNVPNPFAEQTTITYNVPQSVGKAQLLFYNSNGQLIQSVDIKTRGKGKVNVFASDLSSGLYHYTLVADGKVVDTKKMVRE